MLKALSAELIQSCQLERDASVVVGLSGGADSMALMHLLVDLNKTGDWQLKLHIAHLNHDLRSEESDGDAAFVQAASDSIGLPCTIEKRPVAKLATEESTGIEEVGRRERYALFERVCLSVGAKHIALGHHADDDAETILVRVLRGTGIRGLAGISSSRPLGPGSDISVVRPLLRFTRDSLRAYIAQSCIVHREDRTNTSNEPTRNRVRNRILPMLAEEINPQVRDALIRLGEQAQWVGDYLKETVERTFESLIVSRTDQVLTLNCDALARKSRIVQTEIVRLAYRSFGLGEQDLSFANLVSVLDLVRDPGSGKQVQLPGGMTIEKRYGQLIVGLPSDEPRELIAPEIAVHLPGKTVLPIRRLEIDCQIKRVGASEVSQLRHQGSSLEEYVDMEAVHPPLVVRTRRPGDRFYPLGAPGSKKLADFLIDTKVDPKVRKRVAVLCDQLGPIWVIGHRLDDRVKITALTRSVLHLRAKSLEPR